MRQALEPVRTAINLALVYELVAKGQSVPASDVDLLLVSGTLTLEAVDALLKETEGALARKINPTLFTEMEFHQRIEKGSSFLKRGLSGDVIVLIGNLPDEN